MNIVGFSQLRNELEKGNLINWFKSMSFCDSIYIYDQASDDGSIDYYKQYDNVFCIESSINNFGNEMKCKHDLLKKLLEEQSNVDWIFWMDGDTLLDGRLNRENIEEILNKHKEYDAINLGHLNLWRSDIYYRIDNLFHWLHGNGVCAFWRNIKGMQFDPSPGLHKCQFPDGLEKAYRIEFVLIHRGFATDKQIIDRVNSYKEMPDKFWDKTEVDTLSGTELKKQTIERFLNEEGLEVKLMPKILFPDWFKIRDYINPSAKKRIREIYEEGS